MRISRKNDQSEENQEYSPKSQLKPSLSAKRELHGIREYRHSTVLIQNKKISSFSDVKIKNNCLSIDLSLNRLTDFFGIPSNLSCLSTLILDNNQIRSFRGVQSPNSYPKLRYLSMKKNPISRSIYLKVMCLVAFGDQLITINEEKINDKQRETANEMRECLFPELKEGKILANLRPLRIVDMTSDEKLEHSYIEPSQELIDYTNSPQYNSPNKKDNYNKTSPGKNFALSPPRSQDDTLPSVAVLVNMLYNTPKSEIESTIQSLFQDQQKMQHHFQQNEEEGNENFILNDGTKSRFPLVDAIFKVKQTMNKLKTRFNDKTADAKFNDESQIERNL